MSTMWKPTLITAAMLFAIAGCQPDQPSSAGGAGNERTSTAERDDTGQDTGSDFTSEREDREDGPSTDPAPGAAPADQPQPDPQPADEPAGDPEL